ncbi:hypothetical protein BJF87_24470 [Gordonia sp. CNJ-863]|nr:hypothetical protein BJF87_24470 [Gordonia sp. CNJ-863]
MVRAAFLEHTLLEREAAVNLSGARVDGNLDLQGERICLSITGSVLNGDTKFAGATFAGGDSRFEGTAFVGKAWFDEVTFTGDARFDKATFMGHARFDEATLTGKAQFQETTFTDDARFDGATFTGDARFQQATFGRRASFERLTCTGDTLFTRARFTDTASFDRTIFIGDAWFREATFTRHANFGEVNFIRHADFGGATFTSDAQFGAAIFTGDARFGAAIFTGDAKFAEAIVTGSAEFRGATFSNNAQFENARFRLLDWSQTQWSSPTIRSTGLATTRVRLDRAVFDAPARLDITTGKVSADWLRATSRLHLVVSGAVVDLPDAELAPGSLISEALADHPSTEPENHRTWVRVPPLAGSRLNVLYPRPARRQLSAAQWADYVLALLRLDIALTEALPAGQRSSIRSLQRAQVTGVTISGMDLTSCTFAAAYGLDALTITGDNIMSSSRGDREKDKRPQQTCGRHWWRTDRRVINDELRRDSTAIRDSREREGEDSDPLSAREVSAIYRSLRKALEDAKDEPGAADFYYGEMEMRRQAAGLLSVERWILATYRVVSGYGLRAWRAVASLAAIIGLAALCFIRGEKPPFGWELVRKNDSSTPPLIDPDSHLWPLAFAAQEAVALFRPAGAAGATLVGIGVFIDLSIRILGPILLALAVLAIRNRTKR